MISLLVLVMDPVLDTLHYSSYSHNGKLMLGFTILLFLIILIIIFLHTYSPLCFRRRHHHHLHTRHLFPPRIPATSSTTATTTTTISNEGLHPSILKILPTFTYSSASSATATGHRPLPDCSVCLSGFAEDDDGRIRILPNCNHAFHCHCIDTWFRSHSNCPLCRAPVHSSPQATPPTASSNSNIVSERGAGQMEMGGSSLPAPIGCPRKPVELVGINIIAL